MSEELKPCPFCGKPLEIVSIIRRDGIDGLSAQCPTWGCAGRQIAWDTAAEVVAAWNTRPVEDALRAERDAALALAAKYKALWEAVPWGDIAKVLRDAADSFEWDAVEEWYVTHAPQPEQEAQP
jgi:hypothetical protein